MDPQARDQMLALLSALNAQDRALRRDECGDWRIGGKSGHVYTWGDGKTWLLFLTCRSARAWTAAKARLRFCEVTQDGEEEGCFRLHALPVPEEAVAIRTALGIRKRRSNDPLVTEGLRATAKRRFQRQERPPEAGQAGGPHPPLVPPSEVVSTIILADDLRAYHASLPLKQEVA